MIISFVIPTLNEEKKIRECLSRIRMQQYDQNLVEIVICDGGSTDQTIQIAREFNSVIINNPLRSAETGLRLGADSASGAIITAFAADNLLVGLNWITRLVQSFNDLPDVTAIFPQVVIDPSDNTFSKYYTKIYCDPFNRFVYGHAGNPNSFNKCYNIVLNENNIVIYDLKTQPPLLALAQAFTYRANWVRPDNSYRDDITPIWSMIHSGNNIGYYPELHLYHHSFEGIRHFVAKFFFRSTNALEYGFLARLGKLPWSYKVRTLLWFPYSLTLIGPLIDSIMWSFRDQSLIWLWHMPTCVGLTIAMLLGSIRAVVSYKSLPRNSVR